LRNLLSELGSLNPGAIQRKIDLALAEKSLAEYIKQAWRIIEPGTTYLHNWHIDAIAEYLEAVTADQITRLIINIPPRYMKSSQVTVCWPTWEWIKRPEMRYIFASYSAGLSTKHSVDRRTIIESDWYQKNWGHIVKLADDQNTKTEYMNTRRGTMVATSIGGTATGKGGNRIIVDDPHNPEEAQSDTQRMVGIRYFNQTLSTRLDDKKKGSIVVVMQRLHEQDLTGHLLDQGGWEHLCLPAEAEPDRLIVVMPMTGRVIERKDGELLWPEREGTKEIEKAKKSLGSYGYAGQYQQRPSPSEGGIFKRRWIRFWHPQGMPLPPVSIKVAEGYIQIHPVPLPDNLTQLQSWDMAFKDTKTSAYVSGQVWGQLGANCYLLDQERGKLSFVDTIKAVKILTEKWPLTTGKLVEDAANGPAVISMLRDKIQGLIEVQPLGSKEARAHSVSPLFEAGNVFVPHPSLAPWVNDYIEEMVTFPNSKYKDQVDSTTQALNRMRVAIPADFELDGLFTEESKWRI